MSTEINLADFIRDRLKAVNIDATREGTTNIDIKRALQTASKNFTGGPGRPDHVAVVGDYVLVMENKADQSKLVLRDGSNYSETADAVKNYAINGALFYAKKILEGTHYTKIFAFGNVGDKVHHTFKPVFISANMIKELPEVETFIDFTAENIDDYYERVILGKKSRAEIQLKKIINEASNLHEYLRNYGQLGETEKPLVVSAIILALDEGLNIEELNQDEITNDGSKILSKVETALKRAQVKPEVKRERLLDQFRLIKNRPLLNAVHKNLDKSPLRYFTEYIKDNIYDKVKTSTKDYLGIFYREFIRYSGGDGQTLGVVLTPDHITELFCDLVDLKPEDVVLDPCCGTGGFLLAAMNYMIKSANTDAQRADIKSKQLHGIEIRDDMFSIATTSMILRGDGKSNLICDDFFAKNARDLQLLGDGVTVGFMNPPYSQAKNDATAHLSELRFIEHLLDSVIRGGRVAVIVPVSAMIGKTKDDKVIKRAILKKHTLRGVISLNKNTFYRIGTVPCIAVFEAGKPQGNQIAKFINFESDGFELRKHEGYIATERNKDRKQYLLDCWHDKITDAPSNFMVKTNITAEDEWLHSFYYYNDELPTEADILNTIADYLTFEFNMIVHGRGYLFDSAKKNCPPLIDVPPLEDKIWKEFVVGNLFNVKIGKAVIGSAVDKTSGNYAYVTRKESNNGIDGFIDYDENFLNEDFPVITVGAETAAPFIQEFPFFTGIKVNILSPKNKLSKYGLLFIVQSMKMQQRNYNYAFALISSRVKQQKILLPVNDAGEPDYDYMEKYVALREAKLIQQYLDSISAPPIFKLYR